jgi:hypothetical protein
VVHQGSARAQPLVLGAHFGGLHAGLGLGLSLEGAIVDDRGRRRGRLFVDDCALFGRGIADHIILARNDGGLGKCRGHGEGRYCGSDQKLLPSVSSVTHAMRTLDAEKQTEAIAESSRP